VCEVCIKAFTQAGHLKRHKLIHTGQKNHVCDVCNKTFTEAITLTQHKIQHVLRSSESGLESTILKITNKKDVHVLSYLKCVHNLIRNQNKVLFVNNAFS